MSLNEAEIAQLPDKYRPLTAWAYFWYGVLFSIPLVGFICLIVFSFNDSNINRRSFARSYFCALILALIICGVLMATGGMASFVTWLGSVFHW